MMKQIIICAALILALLGVFAAPAAQAAEVPWLELPEALAKQKTRKKPVVIFFHLTYCWRCKEMERKVYSNAKVIQQLKSQFIPAQVDMAKRKDLGEKYNAQYVPTHVYLGPDGKEVFRKKGIIHLDEYLLILDYVAGGHYATMDFKTFAKDRR